jgi:predicted PhzF superfamily epimerase YddE/YHI9
MDLPSDHGIKIEDKSAFESVISNNISELYKGKDDYLAILPSEKHVRETKPDFKGLSRITSRGLIISSKGNQVDFVSRGFFPSVGIDEDPATGSAHTLLAPYWAMVLKKNRLVAIQLSQRIGYFDCTYRGDRTTVVGHAKTYMRGEICFKV